MKKEKIYFIDIDGTLTSDHGDNPIINNKDKESIQKLAEKGIYVVLSSGRSCNNVLNLWKQIDNGSSFMELASCNNGAVILNLSNDEIIKEDLIDWNTYNELTEYIFNRGVIIKDSYKKVFYSNENHNSKSLSSNFNINFNISEYEHNIKNSRKIACLIGHDKSESEILVNDLLNKFKNIEATPAMVGEFAFVEITKKDSNKGSSVKFISDYLNIPIENTIHIGDSMNDIKAFEVVGYSVVMENATDYVKTYADLITKDCDNAGVAFAIDKIEN